jgi:hypothetical protein
LALLERHQSVGHVLRAHQVLGIRRDLVDHRDRVSPVQVGVQLPQQPGHALITLAVAAEFGLGPDPVHGGADGRHADRQDDQQQAEPGRVVVVLAPPQQVQERGPPP